MDSFNEFNEEVSDDQLATRKGVMNFVASNLMRFVNSPEGDDRAMLMLIAALSVLSNESDPQSVQTARRLAQTALQRQGKVKKVKT